MSTITESDLKELKDLILGIDKKLDIHIVRTDEKFHSIEQRFDQLEKRLDERFTQVDKRIDDINSRLNTFSLGFLSIVGILVTGLLGIVGKVVFFPNP